MEELIAHLKELLRGFRSGVAGAEEHLLHALHLAGAPEEPAPELTARVGGSPTEQTGALSTTDLGALSTGDLQSLSTGDVQALSTDQVAALTTEQVGALGSEEVKG